MKTDTGIPAIVLGGGVTALGVLRALHQLGITAYSTVKPPDIAAYSKAYNPLVYKGAPLFVDLAEYLQQQNLEQAVLIPCSDSAVRQVAKLSGPLRERFPCSTSSQENLACYLDKKTMYETAAELGVPHPRTIAVADLDGLRAAFERVSGEIFLKPRNSEKFFSTFGIKAVKISADKSGLEKAIQYLDSGEPLLVQEYIAGGADQHLFIDGFVDRAGDYRAWFLRRRIRMYPPLFGNSSYMKSIPIEDEIEAVRAVQLYLDGTHFRGVFSAELKLDPKDGLFKLIEINPRPWWFISFAEQCRVPITKLAYRDALELPLETVRSYLTGETFIHPYYDFFACMEQYTKGEMSLLQWAGSWSRARHSFVCVDDPLPGLISASSFAGGITRRLRRKIGANHATA